MQILTEKEKEPFIEVLTRFIPLEASDYMNPFAVRNDFLIVFSYNVEVDIRPWVWSEALGKVLKNLLPLGITKMLEWNADKGSAFNDGYKLGAFDVSPVNREFSQCFSNTLHSLFNRLFVNSLQPIGIREGTLFVLITDRLGHVLKKTEEKKLLELLNKETSLNITRITWGFFGQAYRLAKSKSSPPPPK